jgi:ABC-type sulfate/molybdate transport systems ATPase subunit/ABC-type sulfate transport system permease component
LAHTEVITRARSPLPWLGGLLALYLLAPIVAFVARLGGGVSSAPGLGPALLTSLFTATVSATVIALLGTPLAYLLARGRGAGAHVLTALVALPLALPPLMSGLLLLYVVGPHTLAGRLFGGDLTETRAAIVLAQTFVAAPFLVIAARAAFAAVDPALEDVAASLGHGRVARFARVAVPAAIPGIAAGLLLAWLRAFGEFGATVILAYHPYSLPVFTFVQFDETGLPATMLPIAVALAAALVILLLVGVRRPRRRKLRPAACAVASPPHPPAALDLAVAKRLGSFSLEVSYLAHSPHLALLGPSGAGKTLTLRLIAGLTSIAGDGHVTIGERALDALPAERRGIGYVPQSAALMPRRTLWRQVTFGVHARPALAAWWIDRLGLTGLEDRYPDELSGGQQRRVALARALAIEPRILLLDEPFAGLDTPVRHGLRRELRRLQREGGLNTLIVTHDAEDAAFLADEIIVLDKGLVLQAGTRESVFRAPSSAQVASLLGIANTHHGVAVAADRIASDEAELEAPTRGLAPGTEVIWSVRPEHISLNPDGRYAAVLVDDADLGTMRELTISLEGVLELTARTLEPQELPIGAPVRLDLAPENISVWPMPAAHPGAGSPAIGAQPPI